MSSDDYNILHQSIIKSAENLSKSRNIAFLAACVEVVLPYFVQYADDFSTGILQNYLDELWIYGDDQSNKTAHRVIEIVNRLNEIDGICMFGTIEGYAYQVLCILYYSFMFCIDKKIDNLAMASRFTISLISNTEPRNTEKRPSVYPIGTKTYDFLRQYGKQEMRRQWELVNELKENDVDFDNIRKSIKIKYHNDILLIINRLIDSYTSKLKNQEKFSFKKYIPTNLL